MQSLIPQNMRDNPYENIYRSMHIEVHPDITRANAEEIARQLGFLHNTFGIVARDLIKILSFKFPKENTHSEQHVYHKEANKWNKNQEQYRARDFDYGEKMDVQNYGNKPYRDKDTHVGITFIKKPKEPITLQIDAQQDQKQFNTQKIANSMIQPPNFDFLGEFAYDKFTHEQTKTNLAVTKNNLLKDHMSKIIQKASNKKKETRNHDIELSPNNQSTVKINQNQHICIENISSRDQLVPTKVQERVLISLHQNNQNQVDKSIPNNQQMETAQNKQLSFLQQFEYNNNIEKPSQESKQKPPIKQNMQIETKNRLWHLMRQKQAPQIFQISDDD